MFRHIISAMLFLAASVGCGQADEKFHGFNLDGKVINPLCLQRIHPWVSDGVIIVKSLILDYCQDSNWAFADNPIRVDGNVVSTLVKGEVDSEIESATFSYEIVGKTDNGLFIAILAGTGDIAAYRIDEQVIKSDLFTPNPQKVRILTAVAEAHMDCMQKVWVVGNKVFIERNVVNETGPRYARCKPQVETLSYDVSP